MTDDEIQRAADRTAAELPALLADGWMSTDADAVPTPHNVTIDNRLRDRPPCRGRRSPLTTSR
jgi:hypothetical protein